MEPIGYTPSDSNQVRAIAFSSLGSVMCSAVKDSLKIWDLDPSVKAYNKVYIRLHILVHFLRKDSRL